MLHSRPFFPAFVRPLSARLSSAVLVPGALALLTAMAFPLLTAFAFSVWKNPLFWAAGPLVSLPETLLMAAMVTASVMALMTALQALRHAHDARASFLTGRVLTWLFTATAMLGLQVAYALTLKPFVCS